MAAILRRTGRALMAVLTFARQSVTGVLLFLGALGVASPVLGFAYLWWEIGMNPLDHPDVWRSPLRTLIGLAFVGLFFVPTQALIALFRFSGTREHVLFILLTLLCLALWVRGMMRLYRAIRRRRSATGKPRSSYRP